MFATKTMVVIKIFTRYMSVFATKSMVVIKKFYALYEHVCKLKL